MPTGGGKQAAATFAAGAASRTSSMQKNLVSLRNNISFRFPPYLAMVSRASAKLDRGGRWFLRRLEDIMKNPSRRTQTSTCSQRHISAPFSSAFLNHFGTPVPALN
jgi:hypothetical protein